MNAYAIHRDKQKIVIPYRKDVINLIPHAKYDDKHIVLPHGREETRLLRNLGLDVPAPISYQYDWGGTKPFENQKETAALLTMNRRVYVLSEMGVGKTRAAIYAMDYLMRTKEVRKALIVAPLSTLEPTWKSELLRVMPTAKVQVLHGTRAKRLDKLAEDAPINVINHDGVATILSELVQCAYDLVIVDELLMYKNKRTQRWKALWPLVAQCRFVWGMTGAPIPNSPLDAYGQIKLLHPNAVGSMTSFRDKLMTQITTFKWIPKPGAHDEIYRLMQPSVRFRLKDCHDIPDTVYVTRKVPLSPVQKKFYKLLFDHCHAQYNQHAITAVNEGVKLNKLLQVSCGYVKTSNHVGSSEATVASTKVLGLNPADRMKELLDLLQENEHKAIVFVPYIAALKQVYNYISKHYNAALIYSGVSKSDRDQIFYEFQHSDQPHVLVAQPRAMSHGLTLTKANMVIWYAPVDNLDTYIQANARIVRAGQDKKTVIVHLEGSPAERGVYKRLQNKEALQGVLLEMFEGVQDE